MESLTRYLLVSSIVLFAFVFYRWLLRYMRRNALQQSFPYVFPFGRKLYRKSELLRIELPDTSRVEVEVAGVNGSITAQLFRSEFAAGTHEITLDFSKISAGKHELRIVFPNQTTTRHIEIFDLEG